MFLGVYLGYKEDRYLTRCVRLCRLSICPNNCVILKCNRLNWFPVKGKYGEEKKRRTIGNFNTSTFCLPHVLFTVQISYAKAFRLPEKRILKLCDAKLTIPLKYTKFHLL